MDVLKQIVLLGRQAGFFIILSCQRPDAKYMPDGIRDQFGLRIALGMVEGSGYTMMFGSTDKQFVPKDIKGRGYVKLWNGVITEFYAPYVPPEHDFIASIREKCGYIPGGAAGLTDNLSRSGSGSDNDRDSETDIPAACQKK